MINQQNISAYINYLHQKRTSANATPELLQKWSNLSNAEIPAQLQNLYAHWGLDASSAKVHENNFLQFINPPVAAPANYITASKPTHNTHYENVIPEKRKNNFLPMLLGLLVIGGGVGGFLAWQNTNSATTVESNATTTTPSADAVTNTAPPTTSIQATPTTTINSAPSAVVTPNNNNQPAATTPQQLPTNNATTATTPINNLAINDQDRTNIQTISNLLDAEQSRDFDVIYRYFGNGLRQYWDIATPTREELYVRYNDVWQKSQDGKNLDMKVSKMGDNKYRVTGQYQYYSVKSEMEKTVPVNTIFEFDSDGKIIYTNRAN